MIKFGPGGLGPVKEAIENLEEFHKLGIKACEIEFTYGVYFGKKDAIEIGKCAEKLGIKLSIHAPYWINLNSSEKEKVAKSKERILKCCEIGHVLGAENIVFHPGFYGKIGKEETYRNIKESIIEILKEIKKDKLKVKLCPETTGKLNVFGSVEEILKLAKETGCSFTIDFAHLLARSNGKMSYKEMFEDFKEFKDLHCHFSGIEYGDKGEKRHILTSADEITKLLRVFDDKNRSYNIVIINESPNPVEDSVKMVKIWEKINK